jgi:type I restriction enzyme S subunit
MSIASASGWRSMTFAELAADTPNSCVIGPFGSDLKTCDYVDDGVPVVFVRNVRPGRFDPFDRRYVSPAKAADLAYHKVMPGDIVITKMGLPPCVAAIYPTTEEPGIVTADIIKLTPDSSKAHPGFITHYLNSPFAKAEIRRITNGVTRPKVTLADFKQISISLPPLPEQRRIAAILDKADCIRRKREEAIRLTEELLRSTFFDMFGDPATNPKKWDRQPLSFLEEPDGIKCGPFGTQLSREEFQESGVPLWGIKHVNAHFEMPTHDFLTDGKAEELASYSLRPGDIVMTRKGTVGNCSVYPSHLATGIMHSDLLRLRVDQGKCIPDFLSFQLAVSTDVRFQLDRISSGAIMAGINVTKLRHLCVLVPPMARQRDFLRASVAITDVRHHRKTTARGMDHLCDSLVQRAFRGEL